MADTAPSGYQVERDRLVLPIAPRETAAVWAMPHTPDGFCEAVVTVNGRILGTWVVPPDATRDEITGIMADIAGAIGRKC